MVVVLYCDMGAVRVCQGMNRRAFSVACKFQLKQYKDGSSN